MAGIPGLHKHAHRRTLKAACTSTHPCAGRSDPLPCRPIARSPCARRGADGCARRGRSVTREVHRGGACTWHARVMSCAWAAGACARRAHLAGDVRRGGMATNADAPPATASATTDLRTHICGRATHAHVSAAARLRACCRRPVCPGPRIMHAPCSSAPCLVWSRLRRP